ncbi:hypothetical protein AVEN_113865-1 [Araneus ventricosus]|uniref:Uncharacterized protein n=1 Tax=Araneus ventricosus TaxID=182803 RepID=A0A4Y2V3W7_ARAVE|nr:hypothetical protein AVEN_113865-1 [Araneus ventricosus]
MPEGAGVTVPNEPDGNSDPDEQMETSPPLAANPTPIQVSKEIPDLTPFFRRAVATYEKPVSGLPYSRCQQIRDAMRHLGKLRNLVFMATEYEEVTLTLEDGNTLSSEETILRTLKEINKWVSDITCFGICFLDNCNAKEIENKLIFEEAERKRNIPSSSSTNNVCSNSSVTSHDNVNVMSNDNNARKRAAQNESECSNNSRIRLDKDGFIYHSRRFFYNCNAKEIENKLIFEEAERKRNIPSSSSTNNVCSNSSVTSHDNVNVMSNDNNARKRAAPNESECSNNSRIILDKDGFIYPSRRNSVPKRNLNADENSNILLKNKYTDIERLPVEKEGPPHRQKFNH